MLEQVVDSLLKEYENAQGSWLPDDEIEVFYSKKLLQALHQFKEVTTHSSEHYSIISTIFEEVSKITGDETIKCFSQIIGFRFSKEMYIYNTFNFYRLNFANLYYHPHRNELFVIFNILLENRAFFINLVDMAMQDNGKDIFVNLLTVLTQKNVLPLLSYFSKIPNLSELELIVSILNTYQTLIPDPHPKMLQDLQAIITHKNIRDMFLVSEEFQPSSETKIPFTATDFQLCCYSPLPLLLLITFDFLNSCQLRNPILDFKLSHFNEPMVFAEVYKFLADQNILNDVVLNKLDEAEIRFLHRTCVVNRHTSLDLRVEKLKQSFDFYGAIIEKQSQIIDLMVLIVELRQQFQRQLPCQIAVEKIIEIYYLNITQKLLLNQHDPDVEKALKVLGDISDKAFQYTEYSTGINFRELLAIAFLLAFLSPRPRQYLDAFKQFLCNFESFTKTLEPHVLSQRCFFQLALMIKTEHHLPIQYVSSLLISSVHKHVKSFFFKEMMGMSDKQSEDLIFDLMQMNLPNNIWQEIKPAILLDIVKKYPEEPKAHMLAQLGQQVFAPTSELMEMTNNRYYAKLSRQSLFSFDQLNHESSIGASIITP